MCLRVPEEKERHPHRLLHEGAQFLILYDPSGLSQFVMSLCNLPLNQCDQAVAYQGRAEEQVAPWEGTVYHGHCLELLVYGKQSSASVSFLSFYSLQKTQPLSACTGGRSQPPCSLNTTETKSVRTRSEGVWKGFLKPLFPSAFPALIQIHSCKERP